MQIKLSLSKNRFYTAEYGLTQASATAIFYFLISDNCDQISSIESVATALRLSSAVMPARKL